MTVLRRLCLGLMLVCVGAVVPTAVFANEVAEPNEAALPIEPSISRAATLNLEVELSQAEEEPLTYEHTFSGYENEVVVAYWESNGLRYGSNVVLYDAMGQPVAEVDYPNDIDINELEGSSNAYRLPATGEYQFVFSSSVDSLLEGIEGSEHLLRLRVASFYERSMMMAIERLNDEDYEASRRGFEMAIEQRPDSTMPYLGRLLTISAMAANISELSEVEGFTLERLYQLFQSLEAEEQALVFSDMQQVTSSFLLAVERGVIEADSLGLEMSLFSDAADYFKTGEASEALREAME